METLVRITKFLKRPSLDAALTNSRISLAVSFVMVSVFMTSASPLMAEEPGSDNADPAQQEDVKDEWSEAMESIKGYSVNQRAVAVKKAGVALEELDKRIDVLEQRTADEWDSLSAEAREARLVALRKLTKQRKESAEWYGGMKHSSSKAWVEVREGFVDAYDVLQNAWDDALEEFE
jgi:hypothetical protein